MILKEIKRNQLSARKRKDKFTASILTTLIGEIEIVGKNDGNRETTDKEAENVVRKFLKNAEQTQRLMLENGLTEKSIKYERTFPEILIYKSFLPKQLTTEELNEKIDDLIVSGCNNIRSIMMELNKDFKGAFNGKMASIIIRELL